ncbi:MAG: DUF4013 domain-containing protein [Candidatus Diapherotrites archaeon]|nr:DUF4013 domain-containing protein [Candidatus Diapherotrites archaeon]MDZ4256264.1 DUF4013 domain-containing protein [archaeon]
MIHFVEAVKRPLKTNPVTVMLGVLFSTFIPLQAFVHGLGIEAARRTLRSQDTMPHFDDFVDAFLTGLMVFVVTVLYFLPAMLLLVGGIAVSFPFLVSIVSQILLYPFASLQSLMTLLLGSPVVGGLVVLLGFLAAIMLPVGLQFFAHDKRVGSAFQFSKILPVIVSPHYWITWLLMAAYGLVLLGLVTILSAPGFSIISLILAGIAWYMWWMTWYTMMGESVREAEGWHARSRATHTTSFKRKFKRKR